MKNKYTNNEDQSGTHKKPKPSPEVMSGDLTESQTYNFLYIRKLVLLKP